MSVKIKSLEIIDKSREATGVSSAEASESATTLEHVVDMAMLEHFGSTKVWFEQRQKNVLSVFNAKLNLVFQPPDNSTHQRANLLPGIIQPSRPAIEIDLHLANTFLNGVPSLHNKITGRLTETDDGGEAVRTVGYILYAGTEVVWCYEASNLADLNTGSWPQEAADNDLVLANTEGRPSPFRPVGLKEAKIISELITQGLPTLQQ